MFYKDFGCNCRLDKLFKEKWGFLDMEKNKGLGLPLLEIVDNIGNYFSSLVGVESKLVSLIIPAYNEEKTIGNVIREAAAIKEIEEIIVVDDGSKDKTAQVAKECGVEVISHHKNMGKGEALRTGISAAEGDILLFLDADWENITSKKIRKIIKPILKNKADFVKASFTRTRGRVTEFAIKPIMKVLYPEITFKQPISGQFAGKKDFFDQVKIEPKWGIDIAILLDAMKDGQRIMEVSVGEIVHKKNPDEVAAEMSKQVMETILKRAGILCDKHKAIIFSGKTILSEIFEDKSKRFLEILKNKQIKILLFSCEDVDEELKKYFDNIEFLEGEDPVKIAKSVRNVLKKIDVPLEDCVFVINDEGFEKIIGDGDLAFCFKSSPGVIKKDSKLISSLSDVLMYLK